MDLEVFGLEHGFESSFVNFHEIPSIIGTFCGIIISFNFKNGFGFHLDLDLNLLKIIHGLGLGFGFQILNGFGYGLGLQIIWTPLYPMAIWISQRKADLQKEQITICS